MSKVVLRALDLIGQHLRTHKAGGGADAPLDLAKQIVQQRMDNPAPAAPPVAEKGNTTQGSVFAPKPRVVAPSGLYSHAAEVAGQLQQNKGSAEQMIGMMTNAGVKPAELEHAGMITPEGDVHPDFAGRTITRDELHKHLVDSMPQVEEKVLSEETKYSDRTLFGGENYRELLLKHVESPEAKLERVKSLIDPAVWFRMTEDQRNQFLSAPDKGIFKSGHWRGEPNVLAHIRMSDRTGPNDEKLLHVEELQSDWGQEGREHGFKNPELESRRAELTKSLADATQKQADEFERIHDQHAIDMGPYNKAYKNAMAEADKKFFSSKQGYSEQAEYNQVGEKVEEELAHLRKEADAKRHAAFNQYQYGTLYKEPIEKIKDELKKLPKSGDTPHGPYVTSTQGWTDLALKRVLKEAAEGGYHGIVFTPGAEQSKRYDLSQQIDELAHWREGDKIGLSASGREGTVLDQHYVSKEKLPSVVGKELAEKILNGEGSSKSVTGYPEEEGVNFISGEGLSVGGEGMKSYYDKMVPSYLQKLAKNHDKDAKLGQMEIPDSAPVKGGSGYDVMNWLPETNHMNDAQKEKYWASLENDERKQLFKRYFEENRDNKNITGFHLPVTDKMRESVLKGQKAFADGGEVEGYSKGGGSSIEDTEMQRRMKMLLRQDHEDPAMVQRYLRAQESYEIPTHERGAYSARVLPVAAHDVATKINPLKGAEPKESSDMTWHEFHKIGKGGTLFTLGGDRSNLGRLTHINGEKLAWPVDLHAGTKYMTEPNEGAVWANAQGAATALQKNIREAAKKGPVFGAFAAMNPTAVDSSNNMFDALMAQVPKSGISEDTAKKIDDTLKAGVHMKGQTPREISLRNKAIQEMENWPGIMNAEKARDFAKNISGAHRAAIVKHLESAPFQNEGFPSVGITRAAITDPDLLNVSGNMMGHHIVELHEGKYDPQNLAFEHSTYPIATPGKLIGKVPFIERHVAQPDFAEQQMMDKAVVKKTGEPLIIHPYSPNAQGRGSFRNATELRQGTQPINERMLESIEEKHGSSFAKGGTAKAHPASIIPGVHIVGHNPIFHGDE